MRTLTLAAHVAYLDDMTGCGVLVCPAPADDVQPVSLGASLHEADWDAAMRLLSAQGWEPTEDDDGDPMIDGHTIDGRTVIGLYGREPIISKPSIEEMAASFAALHSAAGTILVTR